MGPRCATGTLPAVTKYYGEAKNDSTICQQVEDLNLISVLERAQEQTSK